MFIYFASYKVGNAVEFVFSRAFQKISALKRKFANSPILNPHKCVNNILVISSWV